MRVFRAVRSARILAALVAGLIATGVAAQQKDLVLKGDAKCTTCHNESWPTPVLAIGKTKHGTRADGRTPTCTSCHGESAAHAGGSGRPDISFSKTAATPPEVRNQACLTCHQGGKRSHWQMSMHSTRDVACSSCHDIHSGHDRARDKRDQAEVCFTCHKQQRAEIRRQSRHPTLEGKVTCSDCHNPHGSAGEKQLVRDSVNETCYTCHMEKRGPFVRNHQPVNENCAICHNPHGSVHDNLLKVRAPFLCQTCHEPTSHRGGFASITGGSNSSTSSGIGITLARACLNCHTNIHGTNNPRDTTNERTFRR